MKHFVAAALLLAVQGFVPVTNIDNCIGVCNSFNNRRQLLQDLTDLPQSCHDPSYECPATLQKPQVQEFTTENAELLVDYYCCALRKDSGDALMRVAYDFEMLCKSKTFLNSEHSRYGETATPAERVLLEYCPNAVSLPIFSLGNVWSNLWEVTGLSAKQSALMSCSAAPQGKDTIEVVFDYQSISDDLLPHAAIKTSTETISWGPVSLEAFGSFDTVTGLSGRFISEPLNGKFFKLENFDIEAMLARKNEIALVGRYDFIEHNCAQVTLQLLAAGYGCEAKQVPFLPPVALQQMVKRMQNDEYWADIVEESAFNSAAQTFLNLFN